MFIAFKDYPVVIEPTTDILELQQGSEAYERWKQVPRIPTGRVLNKVNGVPAGVIHFFGLHPELEANEWLLGYNVGGLFSIILANRQGQWEIETVPTEAVGGAISSPSIRMVFQDERARQSFLHYVQQVADGNTHNPDVALMLDRLVEPIRSVNVWRLQSE